MKWLIILVSLVCRAWAYITNYCVNDNVHIGGYNVDNIEGVSVQHDLDNMVRVYLHLPKLGVHRLISCQYPFYH